MLTNGIKEVSLKRGQNKFLQGKSIQNAIKRQAALTSTTSVCCERCLQQGATKMTKRYNNTSLGILSTI